MEGEPTKVPTVEETTGPKPIRGWLILVMLSLFGKLSSGLLLIPGYLFVAINGNAVFLSDGTLDVLNEASSEPYVLVSSGYVYFNLILTTLFIIATAYLITLFFKRDKKFPRYFVFLLAAILAYPFVNFGIINHMTASPDVEKILVNVSESLGRAAGTSFLHLVIWSLYMEKSKRVKATFIK